ncbi:MAG: dihydrodipicolinate synthase family protein [Bryobacteraceae bacterium]
MAVRAFGGVVVSVVTPFKADELIDFTAWQKILETLAEVGVEGVFALGPEGEPHALSEEERMVALRFCRQTLGSRACLYGNIGAASTREAIRLAQRAEGEGVDAAIVVPPGFPVLSADEMIDHFVDVCQAVRLPVMGYNARGNGAALSPEHGKRISEICENFAGVCEGSPVLDRTRSWLTTAAGPKAATRSFAVFSANESRALASLEVGCLGLVSAAGNVAPRLVVELFRAFRGGRAKDAERLQELVEALVQVIGRGVPVLKEAMRVAGLPAGLCRRPSAPVSQSAREPLQQILRRLREGHYLPLAAAGGAGS